MGEGHSSQDPDKNAWDKGVAEAEELLANAVRLAGADMLFTMHFK